MPGKSGLAGVRDLFRLDCERLQGQASLDSEFTVRAEVDRTSFAVWSPVARCFVELYDGSRVSRSEPDAALEFAGENSITRHETTPLRGTSSERMIVECRVFVLPPRIVEYSS